MIVDFETLSETKKYATMSNTIFPRPIAWISTEDQGVVNLAPFSYFTPLSSKPPMVIVSIGPKEDGEMKDTFANIIKHKKCTINFAHKELLEALKNSAEPLPKEISECEEFGIQTKSVLEEFPPMVAEAKCAFFCEYVTTVELNCKQNPVILEIKKMYLNDGNTDDDMKIVLENIGRVGTEYLIDSTRVK